MCDGGMLLRVPRKWRCSGFCLKGSGIDSPRLILITVYIIAWHFVFGCVPSRQWR